ncbi:MAG: SRPBCC family protein [Anaerolineae bacterium]|nr:SRPBCC family protein [Anaerolineae bacterium]
MPKFERSINVEAPVENVWAVVSDPNRWTQWLEGVGPVTGGTGLESGATYQWQVENHSGTVTVEHVEPNHVLTLLTQVGNDQDRHTITVRPHRGFLGLGGAHGTEVEYALDTLMRRGPIGDFLASGNPADQLRVKHTLDKLQALV